MKQQDSSRWHTIFISGEYEKHRQCKYWCYEQFGKERDIISNRDGVWSVLWAGPEKRNYYRFNFRNSEDATLFALRWS